MVVAPVYIGSSGNKPEVLTINGAAPVTHPTTLGAPITWNFCAGRGHRPVRCSITFTAALCVGWHLLRNVFENGWPEVFPVGVEESLDAVDTGCCNPSSGRLYQTTTSLSAKNDVSFLSWRKSGRSFSCCFRVCCHYELGILDPVDAIDVFVSTSEITSSSSSTDVPVLGV